MAGTDSSSNHTVNGRTVVARLPLYLNFSGGRWGVAQLLPGLASFTVKTVAAQDADPAYAVGVQSR